MDGVLQDGSCGGVTELVVLRPRDAKTFGGINMTIQKRNPLNELTTTTYETRQKRNNYRNLSIHDNHLIHDDAYRTISKPSIDKEHTNLLKQLRTVSRQDNISLCHDPTEVCPSSFPTNTQGYFKYPYMQVCTIPVHIPFRAKYKNVIIYWS